MLAIKIGLSTLAIGILAWLVIDQKFSDVRPSSAIQQALALNILGGLSDQETAAFSSLLKKLLESAGVDGAVALNRPLSRKALNVYTVTHSYQLLLATLHWKSGNAVFQPDIDAVFLDTTLVRSAMSSNAVDPSYFTCVFLFLHELGHRSLKHGATGHLLDSELATSRQGRELAADAYAIDKMKAHFAVNVHKIDEATFIKEYGFPPPPDNTPITIYSDLKSVGFWTAVVALSQTNPQIGEISAFRFDRAHPQLLERLLRIFQVPLTQEETRDPELRSMVQLARARMEVALELRRRFVCEVTIQDEIIGSTRIGDMLIAVAANGTVYRAAIGNLKQQSITAARNGRYCIANVDRKHNNSNQALVLPLKNIMTLEDEIVGISSESDETSIVLARFDEGSGIWRTISRLEHGDIRRIWAASSREKLILFFNGETIDAFDLHGGHMQFRVQLLHGNACKLMSASSCNPEYHIAGLDGAIVDLAVTQTTDPTVRGILDINLATHTLVSVRKLVGPSRTARPRLISTLLVAPEKDGSSFFYIVGIHSDGWGVWQLRNDLEPEVLVEGPEFSRLSAAARKARIMMAPFASRIQYLGQRHLAIDYGDFVRIVDLEKRTFTTAYYGQTHNDEYLDADDVSSFVKRISPDLSSIVLMDTKARSN